MTRPYSLHVETGVREHSAETHLVVGGADLLVHEQWSTRRGEPRMFRPADPVGLLPPDSRVLLPAADPVPAMVGVCTCGSPGCGSLWMQVRRDGDHAVWEPLPDPPRSSIRGTYRFPLPAYLDAVDDGVRRQVQEHPRQLARELRVARDSLFGVMPPGHELLDVRAWPGVPQVTISVAARATPSFHRIAVEPGDTVQHLIARLCTALERSRADPACDGPQGGDVPGEGGASGVGEP